MNKKQLVELIKSRILEKAGKFPIGTIHNYNGIPHKKVAEGNWQPVKKPGLSVKPKLNPVDSMVEREEKPLSSSQVFKQKASAEKKVSGMVEEMKKFNFVPYGNIKDTGDAIQVDVQNMTNYGKDKEKYTKNQRNLYSLFEKMGGSRSDKFSDAGLDYEGPGFTAKTMSGQHHYRITFPYSKKTLKGL